MITLFLLGLIFLAFHFGGWVLITVLIVLASMWVGDD